MLNGWVVWAVDPSSENAFTKNDVLSCLSSWPK